MVGLGNLRCQYQEVLIVALIVGINRFSAENLKWITDGMTDELIWGGLGNLRFLQVYKEALKQSDYHEFVKAMAHKVNDHKTQDHWTLTK